MASLRSVLFGNAIRQIASSDPCVYLTFDDGPAKETGPVLDLLAKHRAQATFFLVAETAKKNGALVRRILGEGHTIGNHSLDHRFHHFFANKKSLKAWITESERMLRDLTGKPTIGFRPPAGVRTPPLAAVLRELNMPMILWSHRFYDSVLPWTRAKALRSLRHTESGEIILLHDCQVSVNANQFLQTLDVYLEEAKKRGFRLASIGKH